MTDTPPPARKVMLMKLLHVLAGAVFAFGLLTAVHAADAAKAEMKMQSKCPVMGGDIDKEQFADYEGKRVYFCCGGCDAKFKKDPAAYIKKLTDAGIVLADAPAGAATAPAATPAPAAPVAPAAGAAKMQTMCAVSGEEIDKTKFADYNGKRVYFCCGMCKGKFEKDPAACVKKLTDAGITLEDSPKPAAPAK